MSKGDQGALGRWYCCGSVKSAESEIGGRSWIVSYTYQRQVCGLSDCYGHSFIQDVDRIASKDYQPNDDDVIRARLRTLAFREPYILLEWRDIYWFANWTFVDLTTSLTNDTAIWLKLTKIWPKRSVRSHIKASKYCWSQVWKYVGKLRNDRQAWPDLAMPTCFVI